MNERIIYKNDDGVASVVIPADCGLTVQQIAEKDVPTGKPFAIVDATDIPADRSQRGAWDVDETLLTNGVGADYGVGSKWQVVEVYADNGLLLLQHTETFEQKLVEL